jgi:tetratricopeptide (TPR) repeat protein
MILATALLSLSMWEDQGPTYQTSGWCSPIVINAQGPVTITCTGVDPSALKTLNAELARQKLEETAAVKQANEWAARYHALQNELAQQTTHGGLTQKAAALLAKGDLDGAEEILKDIVAKDHPLEVGIAQDNFNLAQVLELKFQHDEALIAYRKAYALEPTDVEFGLAYAKVLREVNKIQDAQGVYTDLLGADGPPANPTPQISVYDKGKLSNDLAGLYVSKGQEDEALALLTPITAYLNQIRKDVMAHKANPEDLLFADSSFASNKTLLFQNIHHHGIPPRYLFQNSQASVDYQSQTLNQRKKDAKEGAVNDYDMALAYLHALDATNIWMDTGCGLLLQPNSTDAVPTDPQTIQLAFRACNGYAATGSLADQYSPHLTALEPSSSKSHLASLYARCYSDLETKSISTVLTNGMDQTPPGETAEQLHSVAEGCRVKADALYQEVFQAIPDSVAGEYGEFLNSELIHSKDGSLAVSTTTIQSKLQQVASHISSTDPGSVLGMWIFLDQ